jgi:hypothetical protein
VPSVAAGRGEAANDEPAEAPVPDNDDEAESEDAAEDEDETESADETIDADDDAEKRE